MQLNFLAEVIMLSICDFVDICSANFDIRIRYVIIGSRYYKRMIELLRLIACPVPLSLGLKLAQFLLALVTY